MKSISTRFFISRKILRIIPRLSAVLYTYYNRIYLHLSGVDFGKHAEISNHIYINNHGNIVIGDGFTYSSGSFLNPISRNIQGCMVTQLNDSKIVIGNNVGISSSCLWAWQNISLGNNVKIGGDCILVDSDIHPLHHLYRRDGWNGPGFDGMSAINSSPIVIEDDVWVGARCIILKGVHIGARSIIGAGSIVTRSLPSDVIAAGNPCKVIRKIGENNSAIVKR